MMKIEMRKVPLTATLILLAGLAGQKAQAASAIANATQVVTAAISIDKVSDLDFGSGVQGEAAKTVDAGAVDDASNASFTVMGEPNAAYTITLPADGTVFMTTGGGGAANNTINVNSFTSNPMSTGNLDAAGMSQLFVGATRDALLANQMTGLYSGEFTVTVVY